MIVILSPAKRLNTSAAYCTEVVSMPRLLDKTEALIQILKHFQPQDLQRLMNISSALAELNVQRFQQFSEQGEVQAIVSFNGHVYQNIQTNLYNQSDFSFLQQHVRILSGLYGILRPLDLIRPYRLEMGTKLTNSKGKNLYGFWGDTLTQLLNKDLKLNRNNVLVNLASNEYSKAVIRPSLQAEILEPTFKEWHPATKTFRVVSVYAKLARGSMVNWMVHERITNPDDLQHFAADGYSFSGFEPAARNRLSVTRLNFHRGGP